VRDKKGNSLMPGENDLSNAELKLIQSGLMAAKHHWNQQNKSPRAVTKEEEVARRRGGGQT